MDGLLFAPWTLAVQLCAVAVIGAFFAVLGRSSPRPEVVLWLFAWIAEAVAIGATLVLSISRVGSLPPELEWSLRPMLLLVVAAKTLFALFLVRGLRRSLRPNERLRKIVFLVYFALFWALLCALLLPQVAELLPAQWFLVALILIAGALGALRQNRDRGSRLLPRVVLAAGILWLIYLPLTVPVFFGESVPAVLWNWSWLLDITIDLGLAMTMVIALERSRADRMEEIFDRLQSAYDSMRRLTDVDPLTGLSNRRKVREVLEQTGVASLVSLDLDDFKEINEIYGHEVGDSCLTWTARTLRRSFRPSDEVFRLGGDEFLVIAPNCGLAKAAERVRAVTVILGQGTSVRPPLRFSHGIAPLVEGEPPDTALREAKRLLHERREGKQTD